MPMCQSEAEHNSSAAAEMHFKPRVEWVAWPGERKENCDGDKNLSVPVAMGQPTLCLCASIPSGNH